MVKSNNTYCIIPLRKGSRSIKDKNIKKINGKFLASLCVKTSLKSGIFKKIIIATDSDAYIKIIKNEFYNNKKLVYFKRSKKNAKSYSPTELVINEILKNFKQIDNIFLIQVTSPLLNKNDLINAYKIFKKKKFSSLFSSYKKKKFIWYKKNSKLFTLNYNYKKRPMRQSFNYNFFENGAFYIFNKKNFLKYQNRLHGKIGTYIMPEKRSIDIDEYEDLKLVKESLKKK